MKCTRCLSNDVIKLNTSQMPLFIRILCLLAGMSFILTMHIVFIIIGLMFIVGGLTGSKETSYKCNCCGHIFKQ